MGYPIVEITTAKPESELNDPKDEIQFKIDTAERSRLFSCVAFTISILAVIITAMSVGMVIGYSYCYFEHRTELLEKNYTGLQSYEIVDGSDMLTEPPFNVNRTINGAIKQAVMSSILVSKIFNMMHQLDEDTGPCEPEDRVIRMNNLWDISPEDNVIAL